MPDSDSIEQRILAAEQAVQDSRRRVHEQAGRFQHALRAKARSATLFAAVGAGVAGAVWLLKPRRAAPPPDAPGGHAERGARRARSGSSFGRSLLGLAAALALPGRPRGRARSGDAHSGLLHYAVSLGWPFLLKRLRRRPARPLTVAPEVDLLRLAGPWFEVARLRDMPEDDGAEDVRLVYRPDGQGWCVSRLGIGPDGHARRQDGRLRLAGDAARLQVRFGPDDPWQDQWVLHLDPNDEHLLLGRPDRRGLWLLSRTSAPDIAAHERLAALAHAQGFDVDRLVPTLHRPPAPDRAAP